MSSPIGNAFGQYQIISEIGRGGMAAVYKAYDANLRDMSRSRQG